MQAIQYVETMTSRATAESALGWLGTQVDYMGGRVLEPGPGKPWRVQAFFDAAGVSAGWLPDGCRLVTVPDGQRKALGFLVPGTPF